MKEWVRLLLIVCVLGVVGYAAVNNFWEPEIVGGTFCPTKQSGGGPCHSICENRFYNPPPPYSCHHLTSEAPTVLIAGAAGIALFGSLWAAISWRERRKLLEGPGKSIAASLE